jgi:hypothetical protein
LEPVRENIRSVDAKETKAREVAAVRRRRCPRCDGQLTDPARSPGAYSHCTPCRVGWRVEQTSLGEYVSHRSWDARSAIFRGEERPSAPPRHADRPPPIVRGGPSRPVPGVRTIPDPRYERGD